MANRTVKDAKSIRGTNPQYLIEKIIRTRIYDSKFWKEECFALSAELLVDKAMGLRFVGGVYGGNIKTTPFICLILKMLQIQPEKDIIVEFIKNEEFKYVRALGAFYMRLVGSSLDCYKYLEPLLADSRKLRRQKRDGHFDVVHIDEYIDELLREERVFDVILPRLQKRHVLEENNELEAKISALDDDFEEGLESSEEEEEEEEDGGEPEKHYESKNSSYHRRKSPVREEKSPVRERSPVRNRSPFDKREREKKDRDRKDRDRGRERDRDREREREREREKDRDRRDKGERDRKERDRRERDRERDRKHRGRR